MSWRAMLHLGTACTGAALALTATALVEDKLSLDLLGAALLLTGFWFLHCALDARFPQ